MATVDSSTWRVPVAALLPAEKGEGQIRVRLIGIYSAHAGAYLHPELSRNSRALGLQHFLRTWHRQNLQILQLCTAEDA